MDGPGESHGDSSDSDRPIPSAPRSRSTTLGANLEERHGFRQAHSDASVEDPEDDDECDEADFDSENDLIEDEEEEDAWSAFRRNLQANETDSNIYRLYPPSLHTDWSPPVQPCEEYQVLKRMLTGEGEESSVPFHGNHNDQYQGLLDYHEFVLQDFVVYESVDTKNKLRGHMQSLHIVATEQNSRDFYFDGYLEHEGKLKYLQRVPILEVNIGALQEPGLHTTRDDIYVRSDVAYRLGNEIREKIWYRLQMPLQEYSELFEQFTWVSDLMKHFVDFLTARVAADEDVCLAVFRTNFIQILHTWHGNDSIFIKWHTVCGSITDFRGQIIRHASFLRDQVWSITTADRLRTLSVWWAICPGNDFSSRVGPPSGEEQTLVTHNVMKAFQKTFSAWGPRDLDLLKTVEPAIQVESARRRRMRDLGFPDKLAQREQYHNTRGVALTDEILEKVGYRGSRPLVEIKDVIGKVVILRRNELSESHPDFKCSYAYVRTAVIHERQQSLSIVWVVRPRQTMCHAPKPKYGDAHYGVANELFLSDECCCKPVLLSNVMGVFGVSLFSERAEASATFFIREKYLESDECFMTAKTSDLRCLCQSSMSVNQQLTDRFLSVKSDTSQTQQLPQYPKLNALSLFAGCGLLDRGLEDSQIIKIVCAIEIDECAAQSSLANQAEPKGEHLTESVNYLFELWRQGQKKQPIIDLIVAGNPCPPFSRLNRHKGNKRSQRMCSLLASVVSYVEHFLPRFVLIENVPEMDDMSPACAQAICCFVEMGYQVRKAFQTASACGALQLRERLFIMAASPGLPLPHHPRDFVLIQPPLTVSQAIGELPEVDNDTTINLTHPDHIPLKRLLPELGKINLRTLIEKVPKAPAVGNLFETFRQGRLDHRETQWLLSLSEKKRKKGTKAFGRINPSGLFPAIVTTVNPLDCMSGPFLHFNQDRIISLQEVRIAQGVPECDVLVGPLAKQLRQLGNAVARPVGVACGRSLVQAWIAAHAGGLIVEQSFERNYTTLQEDEEEVERTGEGSSVGTIDEDSPSDAVFFQEKEALQSMAQPPVQTRIITIEDNDSNSDSPSQKSQKRSRLLAAFSSHNSPSAQLQAELLATVPGRGPSPTPTRRRRMRSIPDSDSSGEEDQGSGMVPAGHRHSSPLSSSQSFAARCKRIRSIPDSDDDDEDTPEYAIVSPAVRRHIGSRQARKSARTTGETFAALSNTAEDPIGLND